MVAESEALSAMAGIDEQVDVAKGGERDVGEQLDVVEIDVGATTAEAMAVEIGEKRAGQLDVGATTAELEIGEKRAVAVDEEAGSGPKRVKVADGSLTRAWFAATVRPLELSLTVPGKVFSTGSSGWYVSRTMVCEVGGRPVEVGVQCTCIVKGSKRWVE